MRTVYFLANAHGPIIQTANWNPGPVLAMQRKGRERRPDSTFPDTVVGSVLYPYLAEYDAERALKRMMKEANKK